MYILVSVYEYVLIQDLAAEKLPAPRVRMMIHWGDGQATGDGVNCESSYGIPLLQIGYNTIYTTMKCSFRLLIRSV